MGWFSSSSSSDSASNSGAAPDRSQRSQCWESRDAYFACLDKNGVQVPGQEGEACKKENNEYKGKCAGSWVDYFNKRRVLQLRQDLMERRAAEQVASASK
ncbi:cytochrome c oxidase, subunit VIb [Rhodotorula toruloides]|uniref:BY PROTMAP: gi/472583331/gb/EMS20974.1/ cytochrome c oxidase, subunit VIb [Rhodosporidium toruloides NP11] gi/647401755/emb/CDR48110.1/ RHTO0S16e01464g1_1 [Rhodosporidium toruloides] n=1 Tax=Rhodotorula toruloides TaxID=5286 RepID=A0A0K3C9B5_RHOTO|nr:cytochrome c oxidase, subunit VIb [Rhodotorula toruloides]PRQ76792.1 Cytochrome oxidase c subunit VIb-domain containing protein [Rhodotorula toruloides]